MHTRIEIKSNRTLEVEWVAWIYALCESFLVPHGWGRSDIRMIEWRMEIVHISARFSLHPAQNTDELFEWKPIEIHFEE